MLWSCVALLGLSCGISGAIVGGTLGLRLSPTASARKWGDVVHSAGCYDHLWSKEWFAQLENPVQQEQATRWAAALVVAGLVLQQLGRISTVRPPSWSFGIAVVVGVVAGGITDRLVRHCCRKAAARWAERLASNDILNGKAKEGDVKREFDKWFRQTLKREPVLKI